MEDAETQVEKGVENKLVFTTTRSGFYPAQQFDWLLSFLLAFTYELMKTF